WSLSSEVRKPLAWRGGDWKSIASKKQKKVSPESWEAAQYFFVWTTLANGFSAFTVLELYRLRWQIELAFKRMKSIMGLGHLPKKDPASPSSSRRPKIRLFLGECG
ncbi:MAG TPA: transposase, partial [Pyrinomonadaceae bacterium]|nr:transposase [Pyrinomonadaceae bacterium]